MPFLETSPLLRGNMELRIVKVAFIFCVTFTVISASLPPDFDLVKYLPPSWRSICQAVYNNNTDVNATINCHVTHDDAVQWRLADLRSSLEPVVSKGPYGVSITLECETGGNISLPFPMRSPGLVRLTVHNCRLLDKYGDFGTSAMQLGDSVKEVHMSDCIWVNQPDSLQRILDNLQNITSHYDCGQDSTLVKYIYRNVSDELPLEKLVSSELGDTEALLNSLLASGGDFGGLLNNTNGLEKLLGGDGDLKGLLNGTENLGDLGGLLNGTVDFEDLLNGRGNIRNVSGNQLFLRTMQGSEATATSAAPRQSGTTVDPAADVLHTVKGIDNLQTQCRFEQLEVLDESISPLTSKQHFEFMVKDSRFPKLHTLIYNYIGLTEIPRELREWRRFFPKLRTLDLSYNYVQEVDAIPPFRNDVHLTMNLRYNNITKISTSMFQAWARVPYFKLDIRNNPIDCSCQLVDFMRDLHNASLWAGPVLASYHAEASSLTCATPHDLAGRELASVEIAELGCAVEITDLRAALWVLAVVAVLLLVFLILAVRYRREVRILIFTRVHVLLPCGLPHVAGEVGEDKLYDAFVAYAHQDSTWVLEQLVPQLETPTKRACGPCKLCIHQRDFVVGKPIIDNIIDSIAASRHTIVVLSKSFVKSAWAMEELQQAYRQSMEERRRHLVLVVLEDVPQLDMAPVLRRCCKTFTYLQANEPLFWDRLMYSIHVMANRKNTNKNKDNDKEVKEKEYENIAHDNQDIVKNGDVEQGLAPQKPAPDDMFQRAVFLETMRTISVDSTVSTGNYNDDRDLVTPAP